MKYYTVKEGDDLGSIAAKYLLPSWKYLYEINKDTIGDNPDLLKSGIELKIPEWDATQGDEKIMQKGGNAFTLTGGVCYRYPWVPVSFTVGTSDGTMYKEKDSQGKEQTEYQKKKKFAIKNADNESVVASGEISKSEEIELLIPDVKKMTISIDEKNYKIGNGEVKQ